MTKAHKEERFILGIAESPRENLDEALCSLNSEVIHLQRTQRDDPEKRLGHKIFALANCFRHPVEGLHGVGGEIKRSMLNSKMRKFDQSNEGFLTWNEEADPHQKVAVYTCITGEYDGLKEPLFKAPNIDYFVVTDSSVPEGSAWTKIESPYIEGAAGLGSVKSARYVKTHPHLFFPEHEYSIWVDANFLIVGDLSKFICCLGSSVPFATNWHPLRNCIYAEAEVCKLCKRDSSDVIDAQMRAYREEGMPAGFGLFETNMIVRRHNDERCIALMEAWWQEIAKWSRRDQLSLPYVAWKQGYTMHDFGFICTEIRENPSVRVVAHADPKILRGGALLSDVVFFASACEPSGIRRAA